MGTSLALHWIVELQLDRCKISKKNPKLVANYLFIPESMKESIGIFDSKGE